MANQCVFVFALLALGSTEVKMDVYLYAWVSLLT